MIGLDIFQQSAFTAFTLTNGLLKIPYKPSRLGDLGIFVVKGVNTTKIAVEEKLGRLSLVETSPRGGSGKAIGQMKRTARPFSPFHLERESKILADEIQNVRAWGPTGDPSTVVLAAISDLVNERLVDLRRMIEVTIEHMRIGAITGSIKDADGTELLNLFTDFGVSQTVIPVSFASAQDVRNQAIAIIRKIEYLLGGIPPTGYRVLCGDTFFDTLVKAVKANITSLFVQGGFDPGLVRGDIRKGFEFGGLVWENYRGRLRDGDTPFIADTEAYVLPEGADIFYEYYAPGDYLETVNTAGLPFYAKQAVDQEFQRWVKVHVQSNPLCLCLRPDCVPKLTFTT